MKLNLGCGKDKKIGYVNIDIQEGLEPDVIDNVQYLKKIDDGTVDEIYASHILEHFPHWQTRAILGTWRDKLKDGGKLVIRVPDIEIICKNILTAGTTNQIYNGIKDIYGGQDHSFNYHCMGFTYNLLFYILKACNFKEITIKKNQENNSAELIGYAQK